ncbi:hypothetical protein [Lewinella sp. IMCC34191]|uniref:hypothetical protein n=1 Tax=Lewinella sp. IMCC34191 TaxID=2259172 RepID=UPI000E2666E1|nr:hypothetical protein [Lewinella sp. IMCC34191]
MNDRQLKEALRESIERPTPGFEDELLHRLEAERARDREQLGSSGKILLPFGVLAVASVMLAQRISHTETIQTLTTVYPIMDELPMLVVGLNGLLLYFILRYGREAKRLRER